MKVNLKELYEYCKSQGYNYSEAQFCQDLKEIAVEKLNDDNLCKVTGGARMNKKFYAGICAALSLAGSANLSSVKGAHFESDYPKSSDFSKIYAVSTKNTHKKSSKHSLAKILTAATGGGLIALAVGGPIIAYEAKKEKKSDDFVNSEPTDKLHQPIDQSDLCLEDIKPYTQEILKNFCEKFKQFLAQPTVGIAGYSALSLDKKIERIRGLKESYDEVHDIGKEKELIHAFISADDNWRTFMAFVVSMTHGKENNILAQELNRQIDDKLAVLRPIFGREFTSGIFSGMEGNFVSPGAASLHIRFNNAKDRLITQDPEQLSPANLLSLMFDKKIGELPTLAQIIGYMPNTLKGINPWDCLIQAVEKSYSQTHSLS